MEGPQKRFEINRSDVLSLKSMPRLPSNHAMELTGISVRPTISTNHNPVSKVVAIMSMSLDGYVADLNDGVAEVFDWYFSGDVEITIEVGPHTIRVSRTSAEHLHGLISELGAMLTGRRTFDKPRMGRTTTPGDGIAVLTHATSPTGGHVPTRTVHFITDGIETVRQQPKPQLPGSPLESTAPTPSSNCLNPDSSTNSHDIAAVFSAR